MEEIKIDDNLDKECNALGALFQHIVDETKVRKIFGLLRILESQFPEILKDFVTG